MKFSRVKELTSLLAFPEDNKPCFLRTKHGEFACWYVFTNTGYELVSQELADELEEELSLYE